MGYVLEEGMRPPFVSEPMANELLRSGKTLIFLRYTTFLTGLQRKHPM